MGQMEPNTYENITLSAPAPKKTGQKNASQRRPSRREGTGDRKPASLACLNCRPRKIRCQRVNGSCERCRVLGMPCEVPSRDERKLRYSKDYIEGLENEIAELRKELQHQRLPPAQQWQLEAPELEPDQAQEPALVTSNASQSLTWPARQQDKVPAGDKAIDAQLSPDSSNGDTDRSSPDRLIERLCGMRGQLSGGSDGRMRYFGPTSSLHLTESVSSISSYCGEAFDQQIDLDQGISETLQQYLLDLYWTYQHSVLPVVHKDAFLQGFAARKGPYYSHALLLSILASGARISGRPPIRALVIPQDDGDDDTARRPLAKLAIEALEEELLNPSMTTIQSLMLHSVLDCCESKDSMGWMRSGNACRLVFDLGLNQDWSNLAGRKLSQIDIEARQVVFWGCFGLDRLWALYLGRPPFIKLADVSIGRPDRKQQAWDLLIFAAWVELLDIAGQIGDNLNASPCSQVQIDNYMSQLEQWHASLDPSLSLFREASPAVYHLHMQHSAVRILLHRPNSGFGNTERRNVVEAMASRSDCVYHANHIARLLQDYRDYHGEAYTMLGSALYNMTMAATTLVAEIAEKRKGSECEEWTNLTVCLRTMKDMEHSEIVARNVGKIVQTVMKVCNVHNGALDLASLPDCGSEPAPHLAHELPDIFGNSESTLSMYSAFQFADMDVDGAFGFDFGAAAQLPGPMDFLASLDQTE